ncbi:glycoside hydrolase family 3 protein [Saccharothrix sp. ALI-22-I]|uniref:glycoside hydrolase family 3 protein n=1 Tax=Saccharothrix sp. ALI-22-I TaxID=1933778 RepID=UPI00267C14B9
MTSVTDRSPDDTDAPEQPPWRDRELPLHDRVEALLSAMTLEEKVAQLGSVWIDTTGPDGGGSAAESAPLPDVFTVSTTADVDEQLRGGVGHLTRVFGTGPISVAEGVQRLRSWQQRVVEGNRLGIPAIAHEECLTGFATFGATAYPTPLAWAATFDVDLVREMAGAIGRDLRAVGVHQGLSPVLDVVRDYRWGRVEETLGEDPYLVGQLGAAYVRGLENAGVIATLKHFAGYAASRAARNHAPVSIGPRELADVILPPFETALREGGARSVMNSYTDVDGVPVAADTAFLRELLRDQWGFTGTVVSDYWSVPFLVSMHRVAEDEGAAGVVALRAWWRCVRVSTWSCRRRVATATSWSRTSAPARWTRHWSTTRCGGCCGRSSNSGSSTAARSSRPGHPTSTWTAPTTGGSRAPSPNARSCCWPTPTTSCR